ncbi:MBOAT, membrane-bound O-acyltransferase family-domain-containing protein [Mrakia frigida]|uniref:O-acyltransferase n=1 Tax=Mrakia frigida TaxID=29902 RepID=UPI003FCBFADF
MTSSFLPPPTLPPPPLLDFSSSTMLPTRGIASLTVTTPTSSNQTFDWSSAATSRPSSAARGEVKPSRWRSREFRLYELVVCVGVAMLTWVGVELGPSHPNFRLYSQRLSRGWIPGRFIDASDPQYSTFRSNIPSLLGLSLSFLAFRYIFVSSSSPSSSSTISTPALHASRPWWKIQRTTFLTSFALLSLTVMHGTSVLKILVILWANYELSKRWAGKKWGVAGTWVFNVLVLVGNEWTGGWRFGTGGWTTSFEGLLPRWHVSFNITALRLISFGIDHHWAVLASTSNAPPIELQQPSSDNPQHSHPTPPPTERQRSSTSHPLSTYEDFSTYLSYVLYSPLYVAGPIITFNNFQSQILNPSPIPSRMIFKYLIRFVFSVLTMEILLHYIYVVALKDAKAWRGLGPGELAVVGFWNLIVVWLKLLIPWRFFRLWALLDGMDPPENMVRCMANNYSCSGFWRSWHRSYNLWVVRYIYIPMGGSKRALLSTVAVFTFVALWHDLSLTLLTWGWLVSFVVIPEVLAGRILPSSKFGEQWWYRHVCCVGGVINVLTMTSANLIGFVIGIQGMKEMLEGIWGSWRGVLFALCSCGGLFAAVQLMMEYREEERRRGIWRKY